MEKTLISVIAVFNELEEDVETLIGRIEQSRAEVRTQLAQIVHKRNERIRRVEEKKEKEKVSKMVAETQQDNPRDKEYNLICNGKIHHISL